MKKYMKTKKTENESDSSVQRKKSNAVNDIGIAAKLVILGLLIALANAVFNFIYFGGQRKVKTTYIVKLINRFANRCALTFSKLESGLSFHKENQL